MRKAAEVLRELLLDFRREGKHKMLNGFPTTPGASALPEARRLQGAAPCLNSYRHGAAKSPLAQPVTQRKQKVTGQSQMAYFIGMWRGTPPSKVKITL